MSQRAGLKGLGTSCKGHGMGFVQFQMRRAGKVHRDIHGAWQINAQDFVTLLESGVQRALQMINCEFPARIPQPFE